MLRSIAFAVLLFTLSPGAALAAPIAVARQLLADKGNAADDVRQLRVVTDELGMVHQHVRHLQGGVPVWGSEAIIHLDAKGAIVTVTDDFLPKVNPHHVSLAPTLASSRAVEHALRSVRFAASDLTSPAAADLWIFRAKDGDHLAWRVQLQRLDGTAATSKPVVFIDAHSGAQLWSYDNLQTGTGNSQYSGTVPLGTSPYDGGGTKAAGGPYMLQDDLRGFQATTNMNHGTTGLGVSFIDYDDVWANGSPSDLATAGVDAHYGAAVTWDYYLNVHGRNGIRNDGVGALSRVHFSNFYANAFWDDGCFCMTYGDGAGNLRPLTSLDVAGHEMSHGVTSRTAGLTYAGESGGLNEATSDIFGTAVEFYAANPSDPGDYLIGEKININGNGTPLRYMDRPSRDGLSADCWSSGVGNLDVHYSSGVANHFFYLLSEGSGAKVINGVSYDSPTCNGSTVTGISRGKAERIWYRALTVHMTSSTNYAAARTATLDSAADLYGAGSAEQSAVAAAWSAVNVGSIPATCAVSWSQTSVPSGYSAVFSLTSSGDIPAGSRAYLYGTKNGVTDVSGLDFGPPVFNYTLTNSFGLAGTYMRYVIIRSPAGADVCRTAPATVIFRAPLCTTSWSKSTVPAGDTVVYSLTSSGDIPAGSRAHIYGTKNGITDETGADFGPPNFSYTLTNAPGLAGTYVRWIIVKTTDGRTVCQSNNSSTVFQ